MASQSSLNYDVDIVHPAEVHQNLRERAPLKYWRQTKDDIETVMLKWSAFSYDPESKFFYENSGQRFLRSDRLHLLVFLIQDCTDHHIRETQISQSSIY